MEVFPLLLLVCVAGAANVYRSDYPVTSYKPVYKSEYKDEYSEKSYKPDYPAQDYHKPDYPKPTYHKPDYPKSAYKPAYKPSYEKDYYDPPKYAFDYKVKDDYYYTNFGHQEHRDGDYTKGMYHVYLPDGRVQTVTYTADDYGYVADVQYEGDATYKHDRPKYEPSYPKSQYSPYKSKY